MCRWARLPPVRRRTPLHKQPHRLPRINMECRPVNLQESIRNLKSAWVIQRDPVSKSKRQAGDAAAAEYLPSMPNQSPVPTARRLPSSQPAPQQSHCLTGLYLSTMLINHMSSWAEIQTSLKKFTLRKWVAWCHQTTPLINKKKIPDT